MQPGHRNACSESGSYEQARRQLAEALQIARTPATLQARPASTSTWARSGAGSDAQRLPPHARQGLELPPRAARQARPSRSRVAWALAMTANTAGSLSLRPGTEDQRGDGLPRDGRAPVDTMGYAYHQPGCRTEGQQLATRCRADPGRVWLRYDKASHAASPRARPTDLSVDAPAALLRPGARPHDPPRRLATPMRRRRANLRASTSTSISTAATPPTRSRER